MSNETRITITGRLVADPELRFTPQGHAVCNLTIASAPRVYDKQASEWKDGPTSFYRCSAWRDLAENIAESLSKGAAVVASGVISQREYTTKEGEKRSSWEVALDAIGPDLRWATARPQKAARHKAPPGAASADPWAQTAPTAPQAAPWEGTDEPPF